MSSNTDLRTLHEISRNVLGGVDRGVERQVQSCVERMRDRVRDAVRDAYLFALGGRRMLRHSISVVVERGDAELARVIASDDSLGQALTPYRDAIVCGLFCVDRLRGALQALEGNAGDELRALYPQDASAELADFLRTVERRIEEAGVVQRLFQLDRDFLGAYQASTRGHGRITLHWGLIGLVAPQLNVSVESLALKVLAHEYAHALSHLGIDANGDHWPDEAYWAADVYVHEGLAETVRMAPGYWQ